MFLKKKSFRLLSFSDTFALSESLDYSRESFRRFSRKISASSVCQRSRLFEHIPEESSRTLEEQIFRIDLLCSARSELVSHHDRSSASSFTWWWKSSWTSRSRGNIWNTFPPRGFVLSPTDYMYNPSLFHTFRGNRINFSVFIWKERVTNVLDLVMGFSGRSTNLRVNDFSLFFFKPFIGLKPNLS